MITALKAKQVESFYEGLLNAGLVKKAMFVLIVINHYARKQIIRLLACHSYLSVSEIYCRMRLTQSETSTHLAFLRRAGLVNTRRDGKYIMYSLNKERAELIMQCVSLLGIELDKDAGLKAVRHHHS